MSKVIKLKKGLDIHLVGEPQKRLTQLPIAGRYAVTPSDYEGVVPKLLVVEGESVKAGTPLFFDKNRPELIFTSPVSGKIASINRGEKRRIIDVLIEASATQEYHEFQIKNLNGGSKEEIATQLVNSGLWTSLIQRPYGTIASVCDTPKSIFISGFDSSPLAPDMDYVLGGELDNLNKGVEVLSRLTTGKVYLGLKNTTGVASQIVGVEKSVFQGPHPAGNVGVQIHHKDPINKGDKVWTVDIQLLATIGRFFNTGRVEMKKVVALTGSQVTTPSYYSIISGASIASIVANAVCPQPEGQKARIISGNVLTGKKSCEDSYIGFYHNQITIIPEGDHFELLGWAMPRLNKYSVARTYFSWLMPKKEYALDTNLNGGKRALVLSGLYEHYLPMDVYPIYLLKAIMAGDIDKMENLGIYEVIEEDLALCEFVDPSKTEMQEVVRNGINLMIKELS